MGKAYIPLPPRREWSLDHHNGKEVVTLLPDVGGRDIGSGCKEPTAPLCACCTPSTALHPSQAVKDAQNVTSATADNDDDIKELIVIGAGPHAFALALRLLEPEPDLMSDKERHLCADYIQRMRPLSQVKRHIQDLFRGPKVVLKETKSKSKKKGETDVSVGESKTQPYPVSLHFFRKHCMVLDSHGSKGWMAGWKRNFSLLQIKHLRSPITAHCDPYDHRGLEFYALKMRRSNELVVLDHMVKRIGRWDFHGPYSAPTTSLFNDFNDQLAQGYGIQDMVEEGKVIDVRLQPPQGDEKDPIFLLSIESPSKSVSVVKTRRLVCSLGPAVEHNTLNVTFTWEASLRTQLDQIGANYGDYVLRGPQILRCLPNQESPRDPGSVQSNSLRNKRILIVGGGVTSGHLALIASSSGASSVTFIQRSPTKKRQFDIDPSWMGPARGKLQEEFKALPPESRLKMIREARGGGSITPEVVRLLSEKAAKNQAGAERRQFTMKDCVEIADVQLQKHELLQAILDDGTTWQGDMIWLVTGFTNQIENHPILHKLSRILPIPTVAGLPILNQDLSWGRQGLENEGDAWKQVARSRCWIMGAMAGLELGPDALNLMGARQGAVRVARSIRADFQVSTAPIPEQKSI